MRKVLIAMLAGGLLGCSVPERKLDDPAYAQVPPVWPADPGRPVTEGLGDPWWTVALDSKLTAIVETALLGNPDLRQSRAEVRQAKARFRAGEGEQAPQYQHQDPPPGNGKIMRQTPS